MLLSDYLLNKKCLNKLVGRQKDCTYLTFDTIILIRKKEIICQYCLNKRVVKRVEKLIEILWSRGLLVSLWHHVFIEWHKGSVLGRSNADTPGR